MSCPAAAEPAGELEAGINGATRDGALQVEVADNGSGIAAAWANGVGLASMRRRAESLGGTLAVTTGDHGTTVLATLPLDQP